MIELKPFAMEYRMTWQDKVIFITRYSAPRRLIPNNKWAVEYKDDYYLLESGAWSYKSFRAFDSAEQAALHVMRHAEDLWP